MGFEALSRGPRGSGLESAHELFAAAEQHGLQVELDRLCRKRALLSSGTHSLEREDLRQHAARHDA